MCNHRFMHITYHRYLSAQLSPLMLNSVSTGYADAIITRKDPASTGVYLATILPVAHLTSPPLPGCRALTIATV
jgi:hypothetical protein